MLLAAPIAISEKQTSPTFFHSTLFKWISGLLFSAVLLCIGYFLGAHMTSTSSAIADPARTPTILQDIKLNKSFTFPVLDNQGQKVADISYIITSVDKQNEIIIKGQRAEAVDGRTFLIINLTLNNSSNQTIQLNTRDYIRLTVGDSKDLLASDIHNDPVVIQPISTVYTRLGFPIPADAKQVTLHVGQLTESKTDIPVTFTR